MKNVFSFVLLISLSISNVYSSDSSNDNKNATSAGKTIDKESETGSKNNAGKSSGRSYILNEVRVIVHGRNETALILTLDVRPSLEGMPRTLRDIVLEQLMIFDAQDLKITVSQDDIDRFFNELQKINGRTKEDIIQLLARPEAEVIDELKRKRMTEIVLDYRVRSNKLLMITPADVERYCREQNKANEMSFVLTQAIVPAQGAIKDYETKLKAGLIKDPIGWGKTFTLKESELAADKQFIRSEKPGSLVLIEPVTEGFQLTKLIAKVSDAEQSLRQERYQQALACYENDLLARAKLDFKNDSDKREVLGPLYK